MPTDLRFPAPDGTALQIRACLLCVQNTHLLACLDERSPDFFFLPGGAIQTGEPAATAAQREWQEETGQQGEVTLRGVNENFFFWESVEVHELGFFFDVSLSAPLPTTVLDNPQITFQWLPLAELDTVRLYPLCVPELLQLPAGVLGHFVTDERWTR